MLAQPEKKSRKKATLAAITILIVVTAVASAVFIAFNKQNNQSSTSTESYSSLVNYAVELINIDRQAAGLQNVTLSSVNSAQTHADDMLANGYFSHWDMNGYKPPVRYTLAGGKGAVEENMAWQQVTGVFTSIDVKSTLKDLEHSMMYDDASSDWAHKDNILNPNHNKVSIGIATDSHNVYLVQDFEDDYVSWSQLSYTNGVVTMEGTLQKQATIQQVAIFYDNATSLTASQLGQAPYNSGYNPGTFVGLVLPSGYVSEGGITIGATTWVQDGTSFDVSFPMNQAIDVYSQGVYTLYLETGSSTTDSLITYSIIIK